MKRGSRFEQASEGAVLSATRVANLWTRIHVLRDSYLIEKVSLDSALCLARLRALATVSQTRFTREIASQAKTRPRTFNGD